MAYCPADCSVAHRSKFYTNHFANRCVNVLVDLFLGSALGYRGLDVWTGDALSRHVTR